MKDKDIPKVEVEVDYIGYSKKLEEQLEDLKKTLAWYEKRFTEDHSLALNLRLKLLEAMEVFYDIMELHNPDPEVKTDSFSVAKKIQEFMEDPFFYEVENNK